MATASTWWPGSRRTAPSVPVAVITAHGNVESAVRALKLGAFDFVSKPLDLGVLRKLVGSAIKLGSAHRRGDGRHAARPAAARAAPPVMEQLREMIARVARSQAPVHICGESGTGKELVARLIHESGARREGPFVPVNCGAIPTELMESELFGHKRGSFTGAVADKKGLVQSAEGGTLFLDEVGGPAAAHAGEAAAGGAGKDRAPGRRGARRDGRRAHPVRDPQESRRPGRAGSVPRGPVLSHQRHRAARAGAARAQRRHRRDRRSDPATPGAPCEHPVRPSSLPTRFKLSRRTPSRGTCASWRTCSSAP